MMIFTLCPSILLAALENCQCQAFQSAFDAIINAEPHFRDQEKGHALPWASIFMAAGSFPWRIF